MTHDSRFVIHVSCPLVFDDCDHVLAELLTKISSIGNMVSCHQVSTEAPLGQRPPHFCTSLGHSHWARLTNVFGSAWYLNHCLLLVASCFGFFWGGPLCTSCSCCFSLSLAHWVQNDYVFGLPKIFHNPGTFDSLTTEKKKQKKKLTISLSVQAQASNAFGLASSIHFPKKNKYQLAWCGRDVPASPRPKFWTPQSTASFLKGVGPGLTWEICNVLQKQQLTNNGFKERTQRKFTTGKKMFQCGKGNDESVTLPTLGPTFRWFFAVRTSNLKLVSADGTSPSLPRQKWPLFPLHPPTKKGRARGVFQLLRVQLRTEKKDGAKEPG